MLGHGTLWLGCVKLLSGVSKLMHVHGLTVIVSVQHACVDSSAVSARSLSSVCSKSDQLRHCNVRHDQSICERFIGVSSVARVDRQVGVGGGLGGEVRWRLSSPTITCPMCN